MTIEAIPRDRETEQERLGREKCQQWTEDLFVSSPMVRFMVKHLSLLNCDPRTPLPPDASITGKLESKIQIAPCSVPASGGFSPSRPGQPTSYSSIILCSNHLMSKEHLEHTLSHEMIHWYDHCRFLVDWNNLRHHACSEIRAASLSKDCSFLREFSTRRQWGIRAQHQKCVRRRAALSVAQNAACKGDTQKAERIVDEVWQSCYNDTRPYDEVCLPPPLVPRQTPLTDLSHANSYRSIDRPRPGGPNKVLYNVHVCVCAFLLGTVGEVEKKGGETSFCDVIVFEELGKGGVTQWAGETGT